MNNTNASMSTRPNILHVLVDQMRFDAIGALGNPIIKTPNLDRLCREGVAFVNAFSPSPVCIPARCCMIYGQHPHNTGCYENRLMPTDKRQSFMGALADAGYRAHGIGKCHFTPDHEALRGFQSREIQEEGTKPGDDYRVFLDKNGYEHVGVPHGIRRDLYYIPQPSQLPAEFHPTQWIGNRSSEFIRENRDADQPWYLFSSFIHPHPPFAPPAPWWDMYYAPLMPLPNLPPDSEYLITHINRLQNRHKYQDGAFNLNLVRSQIAFYYACISFVDHQIGRMLDALEQSGQLDRTLIVFTSDHGEHLGDRRCFGKRSMHDSSARIPMLARLPGVYDGGQVCDIPVSLIDIAPTLMKPADAHCATHQMDGVCLDEILAGNSRREAVFGHISPGMPHNPEDIAARAQYMAVTRDWKYFYSAPDNMEFLFDRITDPLETRNSAGVALCREQLEYMRKMMMDHLKAGGVTAGLDGAEWKKFPQLELPRNPDAGL